MLLESMEHSTHHGPHRKFPQSVTTLALNRSEIIFCPRHLSPMEIALGDYWSGNRTPGITLTVKISVVAPDATHPHSHELHSQGTSRLIHQINNYYIINNEKTDNHMFSKMWHLHDTNHHRLLHD
jgi:hypothetical protein